MTSILYCNKLTYLAKLGRERRESPNSVPLKEQRSIHVPEDRYEISIIARLRILGDVHALEKEMEGERERERWRVARGLFRAVTAPQQCARDRNH